MIIIIVTRDVYKKAARPYVRLPMFRLLFVEKGDKEPSPVSSFDII